MRPVVRNLSLALLAVALLALFLRQADLAGVWREIRGADPGLLLFAGVINFVNMGIRAVRWQGLLAPIGLVSFGNAFRTTIIGFGASFLLPARAGEVIRPYLLARREGFSATAAFATIIFERVLDLVSVTLLLGVFVALFDPGMADRHRLLYNAVQIGGLVGAITAVGLLAAMFALAGRPEAAGQAASRLEHLLPERAARVVSRLALLFARGLAVARDPVRLAAALAWSILLWLCIAVGIWATARAFTIDVPFPGVFLIVTLLVVGVAVPTPGGVGGFHEAFRLGATAFYGVPNDRAVGAAIVLHAVTFVPIVLAGLAFLVGEGFTLRGMSRLASTAKAEERVG